MPKRDVERLFEAVQEMADRLGEGEEHLTSAQLATELRQSGVDPQLLRQRLHEALKAIAQRERLARRHAPIAIRQAIEKLAPDDIMPSSEPAAQSKMERWLQKFSDTFVLPENIETARAYRKTGDVSADEEADLNELEQQLKDDIKKQDDSES